MFLFRLFNRYLRASLKLQLLVLLLSLSLFDAAAADTLKQGDREKKMKAAIIYYIIKFVDWPQTTSSDLNICAVKDDVFANYLEPAVHDKAVHGRPLRVQLFESRAEFSQNIKSCNVIFFSTSESSNSEEMISFVKNINVLSICEDSELTWGSCMIQIFSSDNRARIAVDSNWLDKAGHKLASELLDLAVLK